MKSLTAYLVALLLTVSFCTSGQSIHFVKPADTDPAITLRLEPHIVVTPKSNIRKDKLLVFFPGTYGTAGGYGEFLQHAADSGIYALGLNYPNDTAFADVCRNTQDPDCFEKGRLEIFDGRDRHSAIDVNEANSIKNRLEKALLHLDASYPSENWSQFLTNDTTNWSKLILSGHSQGAGHAGVISKHRSVARVIMFAGMDFFTAGLRPADWIAKDGETSGDKLYGFTHLRDPGFFVANPPIQVRTWAAYGMDTFGPLTNVDTTDVASLKSHMLCSDLDPKSANGVSNNYHGGLIVDPYILRSGGKIIYLNTWSYLLGLGKNESTVGILEPYTDVSVTVKTDGAELSESVEEMALYSLSGQLLNRCENCKIISTSSGSGMVVVQIKSRGKLHSEKVLLQN